MPGRRRTVLVLLVFPLLWLAWSIEQQASASEAQSHPPAESPLPDRRENEVTTSGCVEQWPDGELYLGYNAGRTVETYHLVGRVSGLSKYVDGEVKIRGVQRREAKIRGIPLSTRTADDSALDLDVINWSAVPERFATFDSALGNPRNWHRDSSDTYGLSFSYPGAKADADESHLETNLAIQSGVVTLHRSEIPREIYGSHRETNFAGGDFAVFVNPAITNAATCSRFASESGGPPDQEGYGSGEISSATINRIRYAKSRGVSVATGTEYSNDFFHTFRNGHCYEFAFVIEIENTATIDLGCTIALTDDEGLEALVLSQVSFRQPKATASAPAK